MKTTEKKATGTGLRGYARTTYSTLVEKLGLPNHTQGDKHTVLWVLEDSDGNIVTVYDWKQGKTPKGEYDWHVGGSSYQVLNAFTEYTGIPTEDWRTE